MKSRVTRGVLAATATLALGALSVPAVLAAPAVETQPDAATVQPNADTSLTIHKCEQTDNNGTKPGTGNEDTMTECKGLNGITYKITKLDYDLSTQKGWADLAAAKGDVNTAAAAGHQTTTTHQGKTANGGVLTFDTNQTDVGAYLVQEVSTEGATKADGSPATGIIPAADFIVTLPMTNPDVKNAWNYNVHVYPKNTLAGVSKDVVDAGAAQGSGNDLNYTIKTAIPRVNYKGTAETPDADSELIKRYAVIDRLDPRVNAEIPTDLSPVVSIITDGDPVVVKETLAASTDYTLTVANGRVDDKPADQDSPYRYLTVNFTKAGLNKIAKARVDGDSMTKVQVTLVAKIKAGVSLDGGIDNVAGLIPSDSPNFTWDPETPVPDTDIPVTPPVLTKYGKVELSKKGTNTSALLPGAEFQVYLCTYDGTNTAQLRDSDANDGNGVTPLTVKNATTFVTGSDGKVVIDALRANDFENGVEKQTTNDDYYCLVETKAPAGYTLQAQPVPFQILAASADNKNEMTQVSVTDVPSNAGFHLPLTGAAGVITLLTVGAVLVVAGGALAVIGRRRKSEE